MTALKLPGRPRCVRRGCDNPSQSVAKDACEQCWAVVPPELKYRLWRAAMPYHRRDAWDAIHAAWARLDDAARG